ncbi:MAG TPA: RNA polymerase Rpb4 [Candidatus Bathyarchaeota archaeon]|nr:MAG: RNA polymerase Rpb4 [Candidatus Bathyarchaeota archaeon]HDI07605.1 RNA polymerase Rpb4 [Candidatus Bathyarchaeota archaeon]
MSEREKEEKLLTLPEVKKLLESIDESMLDQFQRRTLDYLSKFSKIEPENAAKVVEKLVKEFELTPEEAVQIVNCMPRTVEELRIFLAGGRKIIETEKLEAILRLLDENRKP